VSGGAVLPGRNTGPTVRSMRARAGTSGYGDVSPACHPPFDADEIERRTGRASDIGGGVGEGVAGDSRRRPVEPVVQFIERRPSEWIRPRTNSHGKTKRTRPPEVVNGFDKSDL
ncbi:MAG: hypothetical protein ACJ786_02115, partial [Catenulispora sp.]